MAISDNNKVNALQAQLNGANQMNSQPTPPAAPVAAPMSFMNLGYNFGLTRSTTDEALSKALAVFKEDIKKQFEDRKIDPSFEISLLAVDSSKGTGVRFSGIVVATTHRDIPQCVSIHTVLVEGSSDPIVPKIESARGIQYEVMLTAGDTIDRTYVDEVRRTVEKAYPNFRIVNADAQVLHRDFNYDDKHQVRTFVQNFVLPTTTMLVTSAQGFQDLNLGRIERDTSIGVQRSFNENHMLDYSGHPVRADIKVTMSAYTGQKNQTGSLNTQEQSRVLAVIGGYIDTVWSDEAVNPMMMMGPKPKFKARLIMTTLENQAMQTIPAQLLALSASMLLREGNNWFGYFTPRRQAAGAHRVDKRDVGALNIEGNMANDPSGFDKMIDTKENAFDGIALQRLIVNLFVPGMYFSLRVSDAGADTWYNSVFKASADGNPNAINAILAGANTLTNGNFQKFYASGASPVLKNEDRVHMGYYIDANGVKCDIADIDYLAIMNLVGRNDPTVGAAWSNTFYGTNEPLNVRLAARWKMIQDVVGGTAVLTGYGRLVTFTNEFIEAFGKAVAATGLTIRQIGGNDGALFQQRAGASFLAGADVAPGQTGLFNYGGGQPVQQSGAFGFNQRW
jgi:hypothetical protein